MPKQLDSDMFSAAQVVVHRFIELFWGDGIFRSEGLEEQCQHQFDGVKNLNRKTFQCNQP